MGRYGFRVIDADGHGGEPVGWRRRIPDRFRSHMREYVGVLKQHFARASGAVPGGGMQINERNPGGVVWSDDEFELNPPSSMRPGMYDPVPRLEDMDLEGGGQAPGQVPFVIERLDSILTVHAFTHPVGAMLALTSFTVGGILHRLPHLRVGFMEAGAGWLPFWLERLDEHWEHVPDQAPLIDRPPSEYFLAGNGFVSCEPDERMVGYVTRELGQGIVCYASDYCHWDCAFPD